MDPAGSGTGAGGQGEDDSHAGERGGEAEQDPPLAGEVACGVAPGAHAGARSRRRRSCPWKRWSGSCGAAQTPQSLEAPVGGQEDSEFGHLLTDRSMPLPEDAAENVSRTTTLRKCLDSLNDRERRVVELRYGLDGGRARTLDEVGVLFNVTRERVRQIENHSLQKLGALAEAQQLREVARDVPSPLPWAV